MSSSKLSSCDLPNSRGNREGHRSHSRSNLESASKNMGHHISIEELFYSFVKQDGVQSTSRGYGGRSHHGSVSFNGNPSMNGDQLNHSINQSMNAARANRNVFNSSSIPPTAPVFSADFRQNSQTRNNSSWNQRNLSVSTYQYNTQQSNTGHSRSRPNGQLGRSFSDGSNNHGHAGNVSFSGSSVPAGFQKQETKAYQQLHGNKSFNAQAGVQAPGDHKDKRYGGMFGNELINSINSSFGQQHDVFKPRNLNQSFSGFTINEALTRKHHQEGSRNDRRRSHGSTNVQDRAFYNTDDNELSDDVFIEDSNGVANGPKSVTNKSQQQSRGTKDAGSQVAEKLNSSRGAAQRNLKSNVFSKDGTELSVEQLLEIVSMKIGQHLHSASSSHGECSNLNRTLPARSDLNCSIGEDFDSSFLDVNNRTLPENLSKKTSVQKHRRGSSRSASRLASLDVTLETVEEDVEPTPSPHPSSPPKISRRKWTGTFDANVEEMRRLLHGDPGKPKSTKRAFSSKDQRTPSLSIITSPKALIGEKCLTASNKSSKIDKSLGMIDSKLTKSPMYSATVSGKEATSGNRIARKLTPGLDGLKSSHCTGNPVSIDCNGCPTPKRSGINCDNRMAEVNNQAGRWSSEATSQPAPLPCKSANPTEDSSQDAPPTSPPPRISDSLTAFLEAQQDFNDYIDAHYKEKTQLLKVNLNIHGMSPERWLYLNYFCTETIPRLDGPYADDPRVPPVRNIFRRWFLRFAEACLGNPNDLAVQKDIALEFVQARLDDTSSSTDSTNMLYMLWKECIGQKNIISIADACLLVYLRKSDPVRYLNAKREWLESIFDPPRDQ
ncbi:J domain-containing protein [Caenorhabditis elegans]|uniref:J domain-containing protein n=1 Tax=Caenorhabditis elegans TaxID=6239 RepID=Q9TZK8_CAEEL|nr:J domain-containing protein [Caenorhabditis elegans]CCD66880.1 J domain-containing protein [Caenorhabditis elegans]|eukprot:NP_508310.1 Uncharacterized protein CELE_C36C9.1 [Caenorhabditis elegans]